MELNDAMMLIEWTIRQHEKGMNLDTIRLEYAKNYHQPSGLHGLRLSSYQHANPDNFILNTVKGNNVIN